jgi:hypothetical protein
LGYRAMSMVSFANESSNPSHRRLGNLPYRHLVLIYQGVMKHDKLARNVNCLSKVKLSKVIQIVFRNISMNQAIRRFQPNSNWLSAALLTLFVVSFGIFAQSHATTKTMNPVFSGKMSFANFCQTETNAHRSSTLIMYY